MPKLDLTMGKIESALHIIDLIRGIDPRMEAQSFAILMYVARRTFGSGYNRGGVTMEEIANELGIAQSTTSRNVSKLSDKILNPPREILERAAKKKRAPTKKELEPKFGLGLLSTEDDPYERRRKIVFLTPMGQRVVNRLLDYMVASQPMSMAERRARLNHNKAVDIDKTKRLMEANERELALNMSRLEKLEAEFKEQLDSIRSEIKSRKNEKFVPYSELLRKEK